MRQREVEVRVRFMRFEAASVCADARLQCGGGQIVVAGAPWQVSLCKWNLWPTSSHTFILPLCSIQHKDVLSCCL